MSSWSAFHHQTGIILTMVKQFKSIETTSIEIVDAKLGEITAFEQKVGGLGEMMDSLSALVDRNEKKIP